MIVIGMLAIRHVHKMLKMRHVDKVQVKRDTGYVKNLANFVILFQSKKVCKQLSDETHNMHINEKSFRPINLFLGIMEQIKN